MGELFRQRAFRFEIRAGGDRLPVGGGFFGHLFGVGSALHRNPLAMGAKDLHLFGLVDDKALEQHRDLFPRPVQPDYVHAKAGPGRRNINLPLGGNHLRQLFPAGGIAEQRGHSGSANGGLCIHIINSQ